MQCPACRAVFSNTLAACPRCKQPTPDVDVATTHNAAPEQGSAPPPVTASPTTATEPPVTVRQEAMQPAHISGAGDALIGPTQGTSSVSTLIEFPGAGRVPARPQWRKDLSERVREIQLKRAREAAYEAEQASLRESVEEAMDYAEEFDEAPETPQLGLVPSRTDTAELNPLVVAALRRIERARQPTRPAKSSTRRSTGGGAATAVARAVEERYQPTVEHVAAPPHEVPVAVVTPPPSETHFSIVTDTPNVPAGVTKPVPSTELVRPPSLSVVQVAPPPTVQTETSVTPQVVAEERKLEPATPPPSFSTLPPPPVASKPVPRRVFDGVIDDAVLERRQAEMSPFAKTREGTYDDRAPLTPRFVAGVIDLVTLFFLASPFAAFIELTNGDWFDLRVAGSMAGIFIVITFLYLSGAITLAGRTWGMSLLSLRTVDANTALSPTTEQAVRRALGCMLSLITFGLGLLYALLDPEGRTVHDRLSGTVVVRE